MTLSSQAMSAEESWQLIAWAAVVVLWIGLPSMSGVADAIRDVARALEKIATAIKERKP